MKSHRYSRDHGFESRWSPDFFRLLLSNCLNWKINCDVHSSLSSTPQFKYELFHIYITSNLTLVFQLILSWLNWPIAFNGPDLKIIDWQTLSTCLWRWLPLTLSKRQSPTTVLIRTTLTLTITQYELLILLGSNHLLCYINRISAANLQRKPLILGRLIFLQHNYEPFVPMATHSFQTPSTWFQYVCDFQLEKR